MAGTPRVSRASGRVENSEWQRELAQALQPRMLDLGAQWMPLLQAGLESGWQLHHLGLGTARLSDGAGLDAMLNFGDEEMALFHRLPFPTSLSSLDLRGVHLGGADWQQLFAHPLLAQIERLALWSIPDFGNALEFLAQ